MLHPELEKTKEQGYPAVKTILQEAYDAKVDGIADASITAVDLGARSYGFVVNLPESSSATQKKLFLKIEVPFHASKSQELEEKEAEMQKTTFAFMEHAYGKFAIPKVLRDKADSFVPHISGDISSASIPEDLRGYNLVLMTQAQGNAVPFSEKGEEELRKFKAARPGKGIGNLLRDDSNYSSRDISSMMSTISDMHRVGQEFLRENNVPINPTHGIRSHEEVYSDLNKSLGFDVLKANSSEIEPRITEIKESIRAKATEALGRLPIDLGSGSSPEEFASEAKRKFLELIPSDISKDLSSKPFSYGLEDAIRSGGLNPEQIKLGRQVQQIDELLNFASGSQISETIRIARSLSEVYKGVETLPQTILHNDTNPTNFLRDPQTGKMTLIDYDTLGKGPRMQDVMLWHTASENSQVTKPSISTYDDKMRITASEEKFAPYLTACLQLDKLAESLGRFSDTTKIDDTNHLNSLGTGINAAFQGAKHYSDVKKIDLSQVVQSTRGDTLSALDLAATNRQVDLLRENGDETTKSFAERIRPSKNKSENSQSSAGDLAKSSSFADRIRSEKAGSATSKER